MEALNKSLALVLWSKDRNGEDDVAVFAGTLIQKNGLYYLQRTEENYPEIRTEWLPRIRAIPQELRETLSGCEYQLSLSVGDVADSSSSLEDFGLTWPNA